MRIGNGPKLDALCGEYVLGTLRGAARRRFERALREEPSVALQLRYWQALFVPRFSKMIELQPSREGWKRLERESGRVLSSFGRPGRYAGQFLVLHNIGIDSKGNLYTSEVGSGKRAQKFRPAN